MALSPYSQTPAYAAQAMPAAPSPDIQTDAAVKVTPAADATNTGAAKGDPDQANPALKKALDEINSQMQAWNTQLEFSYDKDLHRVIVSVMDATTGEKLRTIPTEEIVNTAKMLAKLQGVAIHTTA
jgi:flagellar protein FlaG